MFSVLTYSCSTSVHDVFWCVIDLTLHLNGLFLLVAHSDAEDPEVTAAQIQRNEVALLCQTDNVGRRERERWMNAISGARQKDAGIHLKTHLIATALLGF